MAFSNGPQESLVSTWFNKLQWLLPRSLQLALLAALSSCTQPQYNWQQYQAAQIQAPQGMRVVQPGTPISYQAAPRTRIAQPQPHSYPKSSHIAPPACMDGVHDRSTTTQFTPEQIQMINYYGSLYNNPAEAAKPMPAYAFQKPRYLFNHIVQSGETFSWICERYRLDRRVWANLNPHIWDKNKLWIHDIVQIPVY